MWAFGEKKQRISNFKQYKKSADVKTDLRDAAYWKAMDQMATEGQPSSVITRGLPLQEYPLIYTWQGLK